MFERLRQRNEWKFFGVLPKAGRGLAIAWWMALLLRGVLPAGTVLRGYEIKSVLGQGAFGITYRARDLTLGRDVAIKEYLPTSLALREGRTTVVPRSAFSASSSRSDLCGDLSPPVSSSAFIA